LLNSNLSMIEHANTDLQQTDAQMGTVRDRIEFLRAQLAQVRLTAPALKSDTVRVMTREEQLRALKAEYMQLSGKYRAAHPDLQRLRTQIRALEPGFKRTSVDAAEQLARARQDLRAKAATYSGKHPEVVALRARVTKLERLASHYDKDDGPSGSATTGNDPATLTIAAQIKSAEWELQNLAERQERLRTRVEQLQHNVAQTPQVERGYQDMLREHKSALRKYNDLKAKALEAKLAQTLEEEQRGESFTLIEPPVVPSKPESSKRTKILALGSGLGVVLGLGSVTAAELIDGSLRGAASLRQIAGAAPLLVIPYIQNQADVIRQQRRRKTAWLIAFIAVLIAIVVFHFVALPLPELVSRLSARVLASHDFMQPQSDLHDLVRNPLQPC
jgi:hypothetical protein